MTIYFHKNYYNTVVTSLYWYFTIATFYFTHYCMSINIVKLPIQYSKPSETKLGSLYWSFTGILYLTEYFTTSMFSCIRGHNATPILLALNGATSHPMVNQALSSMLAKNGLNPADITLLYKAYSGADTPPVELLRVPQLLDLLSDALFRPQSRLHPEHKPKYIYIMAYAAAVHKTQTGKKTVRRTVNRYTSTS